MKHGMKKENRRDNLGKRKLFVVEVYVMDGTTCKGWEKVNRVMTVNEINALFRTKRIETVNVRRKDEYFGRDYNYNTFRIAYPTLETYFERLREEAIFKIKYENRVDFDDSNITYAIRDLSFMRNVAGTYVRNKIEIDETYLLKGIYCEITDSKIIRTIIHEIGHHIHKIHFDNKQFRFSTKNKSRYAYKNSNENFAEAFADLIMDVFSPERNAKMEKILMSI